MTTTLALYEGFADGTAVTAGGTGNSDDNGDTQIPSAIFVTAGASITYSTLASQSGTSGIRVLCNSTVNAGYFGYTADPSPDASFREQFYVYLRAYPTASMRFWTQTTTGASTLARMQMSTAGVLSLVMTGTSTAATALALNTWYRIDVTGTGAATSSTAVTVNVWTGESTSATFTTMSLTAQTTSGLWGRFLHGNCSGVNVGAADMIFDTVRSEIGTSSTPYAPYNANPPLVYDIYDGMGVKDPGTNAFLDYTATDSLGITDSLDYVIPIVQKDADATPNSLTAFLLASGVVTRNVDAQYVSTAGVYGNPENSGYVIILTTEAYEVPDGSLVQIADSTGTLKEPTVFTTSGSASAFGYTNVYLTPTMNLIAQMGDQVRVLTTFITESASAALTRLAGTTSPAVVTSSAVAGKSTTTGAAAQPATATATGTAIPIRAANTTAPVLATSTASATSAPQSTATQTAAVTVSTGAVRTAVVAATGAATASVSASVSVVRAVDGTAVVVTPATSGAASAVVAVAAVQLATADTTGMTASVNGNATTVQVATAIQNAGTQKIQAVTAASTAAATTSAVPTVSVAVAGSATVSADVNALAADENQIDTTSVLTATAVAAVQVIRGANAPAVLTATAIASQLQVKTATTGLMALFTTQTASVSVTRVSGAVNSVSAAGIVNGANGSGVNSFAIETATALASAFVIRAVSGTQAGSVFSTSAGKTTVTIAATRASLASSMFLAGSVVRSAVVNSLTAAASTVISASPILATDSYSTAGGTFSGDATTVRAVDASGDTTADLYADAGVIRGIDATGSLSTDCSADVGRYLDADALMNAVLIGMADTALSSDPHQSATGWAGPGYPYSEAVTVSAGSFSGETE